MKIVMSGFYQQAFELLPDFLKRRIHPVEYRIRELAEEAASLPPSSRLLDAGAGEARFKELFQAHRYLAVDSAVGEAAWDYSALDLLADLHQLPFAEGVFDAVISTQVLEHVRDPDAVLREAARVLKPGGKLFLSAPQGWHEHQQPNDFFRFTRFSLDHLLRRAELTPDRIEPMGGYFFYLGHRLSYVPKVLFASRRGIARWLLFPLELACLAIFAGLLPLCCYYLDRFDRLQEFTLGYACVARKGEADNNRFATEGRVELSLRVDKIEERGRPDSTEAFEAVDACRGAASS